MRNKTLESGQRYVNESYLVWFLKLPIRIIYKFIVTNIVAFTYFYTKENGVDDGVLTVRKMRRVKQWTKFKVYYYKYFWWFIDFIGEKYLEVNYRRFKNGV